MPPQESGSRLSSTADGDSRPPQLIDGGNRLAHHDGGVGTGMELAGIGGAKTAASISFAT